MNAVNDRPQSLARPAVRKRLRRRYSRFLVLADWTMSALRLAQPVVLVSGFWRSGTTWLQECLAESLGAKTVFEPLSTKGPRRNRMLTRAGLGEIALREALIPPTAAPDDDLWTYLDSAFWARSGDYYSLRCRSSVYESLRRSIVVKDVRMQFNLAAAHGRYGIPVVHIRRHPAAVIASFRAANWSWSFDDVRLAELRPDLASQLREYDTDMLSRISAYWAVTESFVDRTAGLQPWARIVSYEEAVSDPSSVIADLCAFVGREQQRIPDCSLPSRTSAAYMKAARFVAEPNAWRTTLSAAEIERIRAIVAHLYPAFAFD